MSLHHTPVKSLSVMQYRRFGRTELQMPVFSCGGMRYQYKWQDVSPAEIPPVQQKDLKTLVERAFSLGINHFETARGYGTSEMQLGHILPHYPREKIIVQTKVSPHENPQTFLDNFHKSFNFLKLDYIDLFGLHGINNEEILDYCVRPGGCLEVAHKLREQGKIRFIGFSTHAPTDIIIKAIETDQFNYVNLHWYYIYQDNWAAIEVAKKHDMGVFIISPSDKGGQLYNPPQKLIDLCSPLSPMVFNDLFCLSHSEVNTLSIGANKPTDFEEHCQGLSLLDKAEEILPPIMHRLEQEAINCLGETWFKTWSVSLPTYHNTPNNINIPSILWLRNLALAYDLVDYAAYRYNLLGNGGHWFPGQNASSVEDVDLGDCLQNSPHRDKIPQLLLETHRLLGGQSLKRLSQQ